MSVAIASVRRWLWLALLLPLLGATGCIEFERQTMTFHYDLPTDELRIFQVYEGIYAEGEKPSGAEEQELASVFSGERTFFFSNWIAEFDRKALTKKLEDLQAFPPATEAQALVSLELALRQQALVSVKVTNGRFYRNAQGQLCGYQMVTVAQASKLAAAGNALFNASAQDPEGDLLAGWPADAQRRAKDAAAKGHQWVRLQGNALSAHLPMTHDYYLNERRQMLKDIARAAVTDPADALKNPPPPAAAPAAQPAPADEPTAPNAEKTRLLIQLLANDVQLYYADGEAIFTLGDRDNAETTLALTVNPGKYTPNAIPLAQTHGGIADTVDLAALRAAFLHPKP